MALQPQGPHRAFHAAVVTAGGEQLDFDSLVELVRYLVRLSRVPSQAEGLQ